VTDFQTEKRILKAFHADLDAETENFTTVLDEFAAPDYLWRGFHPFGELHGASSVSETFWTPLRKALTSLQRREDVFFAGENHLNTGTWVVSMGHLMGLFDEPWLGIQPTGKMAFLRYCEFNLIQDGLIQETAMYFDIPHLMAQAGQPIFASQTAQHLVQPGPLTHDGQLLDAQDPETGLATLDLIHKMISDLGQWNSPLSLEDELRQTWAEDMIWWGPEGIGASYTIPRYAQQHSGPFRAGLTDRSPTNHIARLAEGNYGGFFGWPNFTARPTGGFMGMPAFDKAGEFRVIDIYRRNGDKLAENWIFIDVLHFWKSLGVDLLAQTLWGAKND
jgi:hypothetical protein